MHHRYEVIRTLPNDSVNHINSTLPVALLETLGAGVQYIPLPYGQALEVASRRDMDLLLADGKATVGEVEEALVSDLPNVTGILNGAYLHDLRRLNRRPEDLTVHEQATEAKIDPTHIPIDKLVWNIAQRYGYMPAELAKLFGKHVPDLQPRADRSQKLLGGWLIQRPDAKKKSLAFGELARKRLGHFALGTATLVEL